MASSLDLEVARLTSRADESHASSARPADLLRSASLERSEGLAASLIDSISGSHLRVMDLLRRWDRDDSRTIDREEFACAVLELGLAPQSVGRGEVDLVFDALDEVSPCSADSRALGLPWAQSRPPALCSDAWLTRLTCDAVRLCLCSGRLWLHQPPRAGRSAPPVHSREEQDTGPHTVHQPHLLTPSHSAWRNETQAHTQCTRHAVAPPLGAPLTLCHRVLAQEQDRPPSRRRQEAAHPRDRPGPLRQRAERQH